MKTIDYVKEKINPFAITRDLKKFDGETDNIYKTVAILSKRANQIATEYKEEFKERASEISTTTDSLEEVFENREQIELARYFDALPKPTIVAVHEFQKGELVFKDPDKE